MVTETHDALATHVPGMEERNLALWQPHTFAQYISEGWWVPWPYLKHIGEKIADAIYEGNGRLIINVPPRHGKSELISHYVPTWFLELWPHKHVILTGYGDSLTRDWGRMVRNEFASNPRCQVELVPDRKAANVWYTPERGGMVTAGVTGPIVGRGADLLIIDDPVKSWQDATSLTMIRRLNEWVASTAWSRLEPNATVIVLMQRWTIDDLTGYLTEEHGDEWTVIRLPAMAEDNDPIGRALYDALCPARYTREALMRLQDVMPLHFFAAMYQQNPGVLGPGRVYHKYEEVRNKDDSIELRDDLPLQISLDFNIDPGMHGLIGQYDDGKDVFTDVYEIHESAMSVEGWVKAFGEWLEEQGGWKWPGKLQIFGDATGTTRSVTTGETSYQVLEDGLRALNIPFVRRVASRNPAIIDRITSMNMALCDVVGDVHYRVHPRCQRLLADFRRLPRGEDGLIDKTEQRLSHSSDAAGYRVYYLRPARQLGVRSPGQARFFAGKQWL